MKTVYIHFSIKEELIFYGEDISFKNMEDQTASKIIPTHNIEATIHPNYPLISSPSLVDRSIENRFTSKIYPESSDIDGYGVIKFNIDATPQHFIDTTSLMLDLKLRVVDTAGNHAVADAHSYYLANNFLQIVGEPRAQTSQNLHGVL